jgi:biotin synthase
MTQPTWDAAAVNRLYALPFLELLFQAQAVHRQHFKNDEMELCTLLSIKTGTCPEDCAYCSQSGHYQTDLRTEKLLDIEAVIAQAKNAKREGAIRFCMGAAWRNPPKKDFPKVLAMVKAVKEIGLETCVTLGMLDQEQTAALKEAGLDFYNHNLDTSPEYYEKIISTRTYDDRLQTLEHVRNAGIHVCCGGIIGMGEEHKDRIELLCQLANLPTHPESVPINRLSAIKGTPLEHAAPIDNFEFIRTIAVARIMMPRSVIRLSAGRADMSEEMQTLCFMAGASSMWLGTKLLTVANPETDKDDGLLKKLGMKGKTTQGQAHASSASISQTCSI